MCENMSSTNVSAFLLWEASWRKMVVVSTKDRACRVTSNIGYKDGRRMGENVKDKCAHLSMLVDWIELRSNSTCSCDEVDEEVFDEHDQYYEVEDYAEAEAEENEDKSGPKIPRMKQMMIWMRMIFRTSRTRETRKARLTTSSLRLSTVQCPHIQSSDRRRRLDPVGPSLMVGVINDLLRKTANENIVALLRP